MSAKLTRWFPESVKPARIGSYQVGYRLGGGPRVIPFAYPYHWFDGTAWVEDASSSPRELSGKASPLGKFYTKPFWRGLAKEPK